MMNNENGNFQVLIENANFFSVSQSDSTDFFTNENCPNSKT